jgi:uncharacterized protein YjdB
MGFTGPEGGAAILKRLLFLLIACLLLPASPALAEAAPAEGAARLTRTGEFYATLEEAFAATQDGDTIELTEDVQLTRGSLVLSKSVTLLSRGTHTVKRAFGGNQPMIRLDGSDALVLSASGGTLTLDGMGYAGSQSSVVRIQGDGALRLYPGVTLTGGKATYGGGVYVKSGAVGMIGGTISGNSASNGGGIYNESGTVTITGGEISGNSATFDGGGIMNEHGSALLSGLKITGNTAGGRGGGVDNRMQLKLTGGEISGNTGTSGGGAFNNGTFEMTGGEISGNASQTGGGVWNAEDGRFTLTAGTIQNNTSTGDGGGMNNQGTCQVNGGQISGNSASVAGGGVQNEGALTLLSGIIENNRAKTGGGVYQAGELTVTGCRFSGNSAAMGGGIYGTKDARATLLDDPNPFVDSPLYFESAPVVNQKVNLTLTGSVHGAVAVQRGEWVSGDWFQLTGMPGCELKRVPYEDSYALRVFQATETQVTVKDIVYGDAPAPAAVVKAGDVEVENPVVAFRYASQPEGPFSDKAPVDAGAYWVEARYAGGDGAFLNESTDIASFTILPVSPNVELSDAQALYSGQPVETGKATVTGANGEPLNVPITYAYYSDPACTKKLPGPPSELGDYYVTAAVSAGGNYTAGTSKAAKLTIGRLTGLKLTVPDGQAEGDGYGLKITETLQLAPQFEPAWAVSPVQYTSSNAKVAAVDARGLVTATGEGQAILTATARDLTGSGSYASSVTITVHNAVASVTLPAEVQMFVGGKKKLTAAVSPANAPDKTLSWSITPASAGAVSEDGTVTAGSSPAAATVTATSVNGRKGTTALYVTIPAESVEISAADGAQALPVGASLQLTAQVLPSGAYQKVSWKSSNRWVAPVDANGLVVGRKPGKVILTATAKDGTKVTGTYALNVVIPVTGVALPERASVRIGGTTRLLAALTPEDPTDGTLRWSSDNASATVSQDGVVTGVSKGDATITATAAGGVRGSCKVHVVPPVASIRLAPVSGYTTVYAGEAVLLKVEILPEDAGNKALAWRSTMVRIARATGGGEVQALRPGTATIIAEAEDGGGASGRIDLTVVQPAPSIALSQPEVVLYKNGEPGALTLTAAPPRGTQFRQLTWSVAQGAAASVDSQGVVKVISDGEAVVRATTDRGVYAECKVSVRTLPSRAGFEKPSLTLKPGESVDLKNLLTMDGSEPSVTWASSDPSVVVVVTPEGVATAGKKKAGSAVVTATTKNGLTVRCTITVSEKTP